MSLKKYGYTGRSFDIQNPLTGQNTTLYQIFANRDLPYNNVKAGEEGGWIEDDKNLSHFGDAWISGEARAYDNAHVSKRALLTENAEATGNAILTDRATARGNAQLFGNAVVDRQITVAGDVCITGKIDYVKNERDVIDGLNGIITLGEYSVFMNRVPLNHPNDEKIAFALYFQVFRGGDRPENGDGFLIHFHGGQIAQFLQKDIVIFSKNKKINFRNFEKNAMVDKFLELTAGDYKFKSENKKLLERALKENIPLSYIRI